MFSTRLMLTRPIRGRWESEMNFMVALLATTIGLGDVVRFPVFALKHRERSFLIPFIFTMFVIGIPLATVELSLGQFTSTSPATCWQFSPVFKGVGVASVVLAALFNIFYQVYIAMSVLYLLKSLEGSLPWARCDREWATDLCLDYLNVTSSGFCESVGWNVSSNGACYNDSATPRQIASLWNVTLASENGIKRVLPEMEYLTRHVQGTTKVGIDISHLGKLHWELVGCLVVVWATIALSLFGGLKSLITFLYFAVIYIFLAFGIQLIYDFSLDGAWDGFKLFFRPQLMSLLDKEVWMDAANQAFFTLSLNTGVLICLASFNKVKGDCVLYASVMSAGNVLVSIVSGCITFMSLGYISKTLDMPTRDVEQIASSTTMDFVIYPHVLAELPGAPVWSVLYFFLIFIAGISSATVYVHTVVTSILDLYPVLRLFKNQFLVAVCILYILLELPLVADGGFYIAPSIEKGCFSFNIFVISFLQCIALAWVYGIYAFLDDISFMTGRKACIFLPWSALRYFFFFAWTILCPIFTSYNVFAVLGDALLHSNSVEGALKLTISCTILLPIPAFAVRSLLTKHGSYLHRLQSVTKPAKEWGPALLKDRNAWLNIPRTLPSEYGTNATTMHIAALKAEHIDCTPRGLQFSPQASMPEISVAARSVHKESVTSTLPSPGFTSIEPQAQQTQSLPAPGTASTEPAAQETQSLAVASFHTPDAPASADKPVATATPAVSSLFSTEITSDKQRSSSPLSLNKMSDVHVQQERSSRSLVEYGLLPQGKSPSTTTNLQNPQTVESAHSFNSSS